MTNNAKNIKAVATGKLKRLEDLVRDRHPLPEWLTFFEVQKSTGFVNDARRIDVAAFNTWPSKKFMRVAYEIKATRSDFIRELEHPEKREFSEKYFHQCYFLTEPDVCKIDEVPDSWGLIVRVNGKNTIRKKKMAKQRDPAELPHGMYLHLLRRQAEREDKLHKQSYEFDGEKITQADLDKRMNGILTASTNRISELKDKIHEKEEKLRTARRELLAPLKVLATAVGEGWNCDLDNVTADIVNEWISNLRGEIATRMLRGIRSAEKAIIELRKLAEFTSTESTNDLEGER